MPRNWSVEISFQWEELVPKIKMFVAAVETPHGFFSVTLRLTEEGFWQEFSLYLLHLHRR